MKTITLLAVTAMLLLDLLGPKSSVGGPMAAMLVVVLVVLAVGIYQAWLNQRGPIGWIASIVVSVIGGFVAVSFTGMAMEAILTAIHFEGTLASSPLRYLFSAGTAILAVLGSWIPLQVAARFLNRNEGARSNA